MIKTQLIEKEGVLLPMTIRPNNLYKWYERTRHKRLSKQDQAIIIECYIAKGMQIIDIAKKYNVSIYRVSNAISLYFKKPDYSITIQSNV